MTGYFEHNVEAKFKMSLRAQREVESAIRFLRGPYIEAGEIWVPSPYPRPEFKREMKRYCLKWDGAKRAWHRRTTDGKESQAMNWARGVYLSSYQGHVVWAARRLGRAGIAGAVEKHAEAREILERLDD